MASTRKRDDGYSRPLPPSDNSPSYSSRPPDQAQTGRPSRSGKSKGQSQNKNQSNDVPTDVPPTQQSLVAPPMQSPTYSQYLKTLDTTTLGSGPEPSSRRAMEPPARPPENRPPPVTMAPPSGYHSTAGRNEPVRRDVELETRSRGGQHPVYEDRRTVVAQSSRSADPSGRPPSNDVPLQTQTRVAQPPEKHSPYGNRGEPSNERHPGVPGPNAMARKDTSPPEPYHSSQSQFHVQPFTGYIVSTTPVNLPIQPGGITGQTTTFPTNLQPGGVLGHIHQPPPYERRQSAAQQGPEPYRPPMSYPPGVGHDGGLSTSEGPGPYQAADQPQNLRASNDASRHRSPIEHHPSPPSNDVTRNDSRAPRPRESRDTFDHHPGPVSPPPAVVPQTDNIRGRPSNSNSYLSIPESSPGSRPGGTTITPPDHRYPPPPPQSRPPVNRQPSPQPPPVPRIPPNPNPTRVEPPRRKGGLAALCGCGRQ